MQRTLRSEINATGIGAHNGRQVFITLRPAAENTGIVFRRVDLSHIVSIPAHYSYLVESQMCTALGCEGEVVCTIEHLLAAFIGMGVDNAYVDLDGPELPIMDGSASPFVFLIQSAGIVEQNVLRSVIRIKEEVRVCEGDKYVSLKPYEGFKIDYRLKHDHPVFNEENSQVSVDFSASSFTRELARARTFGFVKEYEYLRNKKLALGSSLENTVAIDRFRILNEGGLRYPDECARHKALDAYGDLFLFGSPVLAHFEGCMSGHRMNQLLVKKVMSTSSCYEIVKQERATGALASCDPCLSS